MSLRARIARLVNAAGEWDDPTPAPPAPPVLVQRGILKVGPYLVLVPAETPIRGVKLVTLDAEFLRNFERVSTQFHFLQEQLKEVPQSLRKRKASKPRVTMPELGT
jgi:hypothetical protein